MRRKHTVHKKGSFKKWLLLLFLIGLCFVAFELIVSRHSSLFLGKKDRINVLFYDKYPIVYSLGVQEQGDYKISFYPDLKLNVPGGYGEYRIGALGKLVALEKQPDILKKTFSSATSVFIDLYFYPGKQDIYFGPREKNTNLNLQTIFFSRSNATFLDRIFLFYHFVRATPSQFSELPLVEQIDKKGESVFIPDNFAQLYQGYMYQQTYRNEKKEVQILYTKNYDGASRISKILVGNGIRVSDISSTDNAEKTCTVMESADSFSQTSKNIASFLNCDLKKKHSDLYDILIQLGRRADEW